MIEELRVQKRHRSYVPMRLYRRISGMPAIETLARNISPGGVCCISYEALPVGTEVHLELDLSTSRDPVLLNGRTLWFKIIPESDQFELGIVFKDIDSQAQLQLGLYIETLADRALGV